MSIAEKKAISSQEEQMFWQAIDVSNSKKQASWDAYDIDEHLENLVKYLAQFEKNQLISFERVLQQKLAQLYTAEIAELSIIMECEFSKDEAGYNFDVYVSDDGFIYFRCWLILKGKEFFDDIQSDIQNFVSGKYSFDIGNCWAEGLLYVTDEAYSIAHDNEDEAVVRDAVGEQYPENDYDGGDYEMQRDIYAGNALHKTYPRLVEEICELRVS